MKKTRFTEEQIIRVLKSRKSVAGTESAQPRLETGALNSAAWKSVICVSLKLCKTKTIV